MMGVITHYTNYSGLSDRDWEYRLICFISLYGYEVMMAIIHCIPRKILHNHICICTVSHMYFLWYWPLPLVVPCHVYKHQKIIVIVYHIEVPNNHFGMVFVQVNSTSRIGIDHISVTSNITIVPRFYPSLIQCTCFYPWFFPSSFASLMLSR